MWLNYDLCSLDFYTFWQANLSLRNKRILKWQKNQKQNKDDRLLSPQKWLLQNSWTVYNTQSQRQNIFTWALWAQSFTQWFS